MTFDIGPGAKAQRLHRDDKTFHVDRINQLAVGYCYYDSWGEDNIGKRRNLSSP